MKSFTSTFSLNFTTPGILNIRHFSSTSALFAKRKLDEVSDVENAPERVGSRPTSHSSSVADSQPETDWKLPDISLQTLSDRYAFQCQDSSITTYTKLRDYLSNYEKFWARNILAEKTQLYKADYTVASQDIRNNNEETNLSLIKRFFSTKTRTGVKSGDQYVTDSAVLHDKLDELHHTRFEVLKKAARNCSHHFDTKKSDWNTFSPLEQFEIRDLLSLHAPILDNIYISLTNIGLYLIIGFILSVSIKMLLNNFNKVVSNNWSISMESMYATVHSIVTSQINEKKGQVYFPFMYSLFVFILINNLIGMVPYSFASTSHFALTFSLSFSIVLGATILGFQKHGLEFFSLFVPAGCPLGLLPLLVLIEFISYLARNVSLGLRLAANILAGHMLLNILSGFTYNMMISNLMFFIIALLPLSFIILFSGLELAIAFIQAQVFVVLSCSYIKDAMELH